MKTFAQFVDATVAPTDHDRLALWAKFNEVGLPTTQDEVWRYAPLATFDLDHYVANDPAVAEDPAYPGAFGDTISSITHTAATVIELVNGELKGDPTSNGVTVSRAPSSACVGDADFVAQYGSDAFALLNGALAPATVVIDVAPGVTAGQVVVISHVAARAAFASLQLRVGAGARLQLVELVLGGDDSLVVGRGEYLVGDGAHLDVATFQRLARTAWHVSRTTAFLGRDATVRQSVVGLGGGYDRARNDAVFTAPGGANELRTTYFGGGDQVHDLRTHQQHRAGRTTSVLMSKGVVADHARSVYTGLIEIEKGARRSDARQTNVNLLLSPHAHADTVPNLDIKENDVVCAHASSVGPLDEMQRWYLESRGVAPDEAERLMVLGFFNEMTEAMPAGVAEAVRRDVAAALSETGSPA